MKLTDFIHPSFGEEIRTISGHYSFAQEHRLEFHGKEILYITGYAVMDSTCCGMGGCYFSLVPGFISRWQYRTSPKGEAVTEVESVKDEDTQKELTRLITSIERCTQVNFL